MNKVLNAIDSVLAELAGNDAIVSESDSGSIDFTVASLVNELRNVLSRWITESNMWLNNLNHVPCSLVQFDEHTIVQLSQSHQLQNLLWLWSKLIDTKTKHHKLVICTMTMN